MNLAELNNCLNPNAIYENGMISRIFKILEACESSKDLMIGIYLIEKDHFLYCNHKLKNIVGKNCTKLLGNGWKFWFSIIDPKEVIAVKKQVREFFVTSDMQASLALRYHIANFKGDRICLKHEIYLHQLERQKMAVNYLFNVTEKERIEQCFRVSKKRDGTTANSKEPCLRISAREREVLELIANGFSSKEIAAKLFISRHTAISHRKNLIEKFQVKNTAHLVKKSVLYVNP